MDVAYDANGNTLDENIPTAGVSSSVAHHDKYDFENRLIRRSDGTTTIDLVYDGDGNRIRKIVTQGGQMITTTYLVDEVNPTGYSQVLAERTAIGEAMLAEAKSGDRILIMGARDDTLIDFARGLVERLAETQSA